ncbi:MAG: SRPBCC family protein [Desulfuromonadales bacterium]|nr:SRPBCC family protein [Desulfuromonadales bacterium]
MHLLEREIILDAKPDTVWEFLSTPVNLNQLTPPDLHFQVLSDVPGKMFNGLTILYAIQIPIFGKRRWLTEIKHIQEGIFFVDEQRLGPYKFWYHQHRIERFESKQTRMIDRVFYELPYGVIGRLVHRFRVKKMLEEIFDYRARRLVELFGQ